MGIGEGVGLTGLSVIMEPASCVNSQRIPLKHMPIGETKHGEDYRLGRDTIVFDDTDGREVFGVHIVDDAIAESEEQFKVFFGDLPAGVTAAQPDTMLVTIYDNDSPRPGRPENLMVTASDREITLAWSPPSSGVDPASYEYQYEGSGTFVDWAMVSGGDAARSVTVTGLTNGAEYTFEVRARSANGGGPVASGSGTPIPNMSISDETVGEDEETVTLAVTLSAITTQDVTVGYATADGTAMAGTDYTGVTNGSLEITAGTTSGEIAVAITDDTADDDGETFTVTLSNVANAAIDDGEATVTITDNDDPVPGAPSSLSVTSGDREVTLTWAPPSTGGDPTAYGYRYKSGTQEFGDSTVVAGGAAARSVTVTGLVNGTEYTFEMWARNGTGVGPAAGTTATPTPSLSIADETVDEGDGTVTLTVMLSASSTQDVTVGYATADGTAVAGTDYTGVTNGSLAITAGTTSGEISVAITDDTEDDDGETFTVTLSNPGNATIDDAEATVTITDNDDPVPGAPMGLGATAGDREVTLTWEPPSGGSTPFGYGYRYKVGAGAFGDTTSVTGGAAARTVTVTGLANGTEHTFEVWANNTTGPGPAATATATPIPSLSIGDETVGEGDGTVTLTVTLSASSAQDVTVSYATVDGTASAGTDYTGVTSGSLTITAGTTSGEISVAITDDTADDDGETFTVTLSNPTNAKIDVREAVVTITDNDDPVPGAPMGLGATAGDREVTLTWEPPSGGSTPIGYGYRYKVGSGAFGDTTSVAGGSAARTVTVTGLANGTEHTFEVWANNTTGPGPAATATATPIPSLSIGDETVGEGDGTVTLTVTLSASSAQDVTVSYATVDGTASAGTDYTATSGSLTITAGNTSGEISVAITDDTADDDGETFTVTLSNPTNAKIDVREAVVTITDNDDPVPGAPENLMAEAGDREVTLTWEPPSGGSTPIGYGYRYKVGSGAFGDTTSVTGGAAARTVTVTGLANGTEHTFEVWANNTTGPGPAATATATPIPSLSIGDETVGEGDGTVTLTVTLSASSAQDVTVSYATVDGTASAGTDYTGVTSGSLTITAGNTSGEISVAITDDTEDDDGETFTVTLSNPTNAKIDVREAVVTITDNDDPIPGAPENLMAEAGDREVTLTWEPPSMGGDPTSYEYRYHEGSQALEDWETVAGGAVARSVTVTGLTNRALHTFEVQARNGTGPGPAATVTATPVPADIPALSISSVVVKEDAVTAELTVKLRPASDQQVTVDYATQDGTATAADEDYVESSGTLTFVAGDTSMVISVEINDDMADEEDESLTVILTNATADAEIGVGTATITIEDNDDSPPDPPENLAAEERDERVTLSWSPPADNGGAPVTGYQYRYEVGQDPAWTDSWEDVPAGAQARQVAITTLTNETEYSFQVRARNRAGPGDPATVLATPGADPVVIVAPQSLVLVEGTDADYTIVLGSRPDATVTIQMITNLANTDLTVNPVEIEFTTSNWRQSQTVRVESAVDADSEDEPSVELVHVASGGRYTGTSVPSVIVDVTDNGQPFIGGRDATGEEGVARELVFDISLSFAASDEVTVQYTTSDGSAVAGEDYVATSGTLTFPSGTTRGRIGVPLLDDSIEEEAETFQLQLSDPVNGIIDTSDERLVLTGTILDSDISEASVSFARSAYRVQEGDRVEVEVRLTRAAGSRAGIPIEVSLGPGVQDADFSVSDTVFFGAGDTRQVVDFLAVPDEVDEDDEVVTLELGPMLPEGFVRGNQMRTEVTISDDDERGVTLSTTSLRINEGASDSYTMELNSRPTGAVTVAVTTDLAQTDVTVSPSALQFTPADWSAPQTIVVSVATDPDAVQDPGVVLHHRATGGDYAGVSVESVTVTIVEDDRTTLSVANAEAAEGDGEMTFRVSVDAPGEQQVSARYATVSGTAREDVDYEGTEGTVVVPPGQTSAEIVVQLVDDTVNETAETFQLRLTEFVNANQGIASVSATGTILDDDLPTVSLTALGPGIVEGEAARFRLDRTGALGATLTVPIEVEQTGDFLASTPPSTVTFAANSRQATLDLATVDDDLNEPDGEIKVTVTSNDAYTIEGPASIRLPVADNDAESTILIAGDRVQENAGAVSLQVTLLGSSTRSVRVDWTTADGTARAGEDYEAASGTLTLAPGQLRSAIQITVLDDFAPEEDETFTVTLSNPANATIQVGVATATITDDDETGAQVYMSRFGRTVASQVVEGFTDRLDARDTQWSLQQATGQAQSLLRQGRGLSLRQMVDGTSFQLSRQIDQQGGVFAGGTLTAWARAVYSGFGGAEEDVSLDGGVLTGLAGVDYEWGNVLAGLAVSHSLGDGTFGSLQVGQLPTLVESALSNVYPYVRVNLNERLSAWGIGGFGGGDMGVEGLSSDNGTNMAMAAIGGRSSLVNLTGFGTRLALAAKADVLFVQMTSDDRPGFSLTDADASRVRLMVEASTGSRMGMHTNLGSRLELGVRHDGGDAETGLGLEVGGALSYTDRSRGLSVEATIRRMLAHQDGAFGEWGIGGTVAYQPWGPNEGLSVRLGSSLGVSQSGVQELWSRYPAQDLSTRFRRDATRNAEAGQVGAQVHYAFKPFGGDLSMAPYAEWAVGRGTGGRSPRLGWRIEVMKSFRLSLESDLPGLAYHHHERRGMTLRGSLSR